MELGLLAAVALAMLVLCGGAQAMEASATPAASAEGFVPPQDNSWNPVLEVAGVAAGLALFLGGYILVTAGEKNKF